MQCSKMNSTTRDWSPLLDERWIRSGTEKHASGSRLKYARKPTKKFLGAEHHERPELDFSFLFPIKRRLSEARSLPHNTLALKTRDTKVSTQRHFIPEVSLMELSVYRLALPKLSTYHTSAEVWALATQPKFNQEHCDYTFRASVLLTSRKYARVLQGDIVENQPTSVCFNRHYYVFINPFVSRYFPANTVRTQK